MLFTLTDLLLLQISAYLDPFTLADLSADEINEAEYLIMCEAKTFTNEHETPSTTTTALEQTQQQQQQKSSSSSFNSSKQSSFSILSQFKASCHLLSKDVTSISKKESKSTTLTLKQECSVYISTSKSSQDFQSYWNEKKSVLPILSSFARRFNCMPATSVASESAFSVAGYIDRKQRASLSPTTLRYLMLLKS